MDVVAPSSAGTYESFHIPEGNIFTTDRTGALGYNNNGYHSEYYVRELDQAGNYTKFFGGTSSACPLVAGLAGLIISEAPNLKYDEIIDIIKTTTDKIGNGYDDNGHCDDFGYGKVNAKKALEKASLLSTCKPDVQGEICDNNKDDDCDGFIDSADSDCNDYNPCIEYPCPEHSECVFENSFNPESFNSIKLTCECNLGYKKSGNVCIVDPEYNPCEGIRCSNHGVCRAVTITEVECVCDEGYHNEGESGLICRKDDACTYVECSENQFCDLSDASCHCKRGYYDEDGKCLKYDAGSLCENAMCFENARCNNADGNCYCNEGYEEDADGKCIKSENSNDNKNEERKTQSDSGCNFSSRENTFFMFFIIFFTMIIGIRRLKAYNKLN